MLHLRLCRWCLSLSKRLISAVPSLRWSLLRHPHPGTCWIPLLPIQGVMFSSSASCFFQRGKVIFFNSTANWNRIFRCFNTFVPGCSTWFLGSGPSSNLLFLCECCRCSTGPLPELLAWIRHLCSPPNIKSHNPKVDANTRQIFQWCLISISNLL